MQIGKVSASGASTAIGVGERARLLGRQQESGAEHRTLFFARGALSGARPFIRAPLR